MFEVDGGEWLDFVGADLKHLTPRPEPVELPAQPRRRSQHESIAVEPEEAEVAAAAAAAEPAPNPIREPVACSRQRSPSLNRQLERHRGRHQPTSPTRSGATISFAFPPLGEEGKLK